MALPSKRAPRAAEPDTPARGPLACGATDCPLPGSCSEATSGGGRFYCGFHLGCQPHESARVTSILWQHKPITDALVATLNLGHDAPCDVHAHRAHIRVTVDKLQGMGYVVELASAPKQQIDDISRLAYVLAMVLGGYVQGVRDNPRNRRQETIPGRTAPVAQAAASYVPEVRK